MNLSVGLSGIRAAQRGMEIVGTNIANASTEGYHRQSLNLTAVPTGDALSSTVGGVKIADISRAYDKLLELELTRQQPAYGQLQQELKTLSQVERLFGSLGEQDLGYTISSFFSAMNELSANPTSRAIQEQLIWAADSMTSQFNNLSNFMQEMSESLVLQGKQISESVNNLTSEIAGLNDEILSIELAQGNANLLKDRRDQAINELSQFLPITLDDVEDQPGVVNVKVWSTPLVVSNTSTDIDVDTVDSGEIGFSVKGAAFYDTEVTGGEMGGVFKLINEIIPGIKTGIDNVAKTIIDEVNKIHIQGVGQDGSFSSLRGVAFADATDVLGDLGITAGELHIRINDTVNGTSVYNTITVDPADTVADVVAQMDALADFSASFANSRILMDVDDVNTHTFDFLPVSFEDTSFSTSTSTADVSGIYKADTNEEYTITVVGTGQVGLDNVKLRVEDSGGNYVKSLDVSHGYAAGDKIEIIDGLCVAFSAGNLTNGDTMTVKALALSDETGLLATAGINTFFVGSDAHGISVQQAYYDDPSQIATMLSPNLDDNTNAAKMAELVDKRFSNISGMTLTESFRSTVTSVGELIIGREARKTSMENIITQLLNQREEVGGVDVNDEAAKLMVFERMFQAMSKVINTQQESLNYLMDIL